MADDPMSLKDKVLARGEYVARFARGDDDLKRSQRLRHRCFIEDVGAAARPDGFEQDRFDPLCDHVLIEDSSGKLVCSFRTMVLNSGADLHASYSAQYYDLKRLLEYAQPMLELGRFCVSPEVRDPDVVRIAWGMLALIVDARAVGVLFGCSSFAGTDSARYEQAFALLAAQHQAPEMWRVGGKAPEVVRFGDGGLSVVDHARATAQVPALLKTYLSMGGWVSDHAVVDHDLNTLHVFTGLEIAKIPAARAKALRAIGRPDASGGSLGVR